jgi:hypothetical protein
MACFIAPATAAIVATAVRKKIPSRYHIEWLLSMIWGGVVWLIPEHIYHGEVVFYPPFFTAGISEIIPEVLMVGIPMVVVTVVAWAIMLMVSTIFNSQKLQPRVVSLMLCGAFLMIIVDKLLA